MRLLMLYGVNCTIKIWDCLRPYLSDFQVDYVEYPHSLTKRAKNVDELSKWVYDTYGKNTYDVVIGHSLGGIVALQLASQYRMSFKEIIYIDTNLKPANKFYRNLMTPSHMKELGPQVTEMLKEERGFYTPEMFEALQKDFDYTNYLKDIPYKVHAIYGDRNMAEYENKVADLNLSRWAFDKLDIRFVNNACHMIMIENPKGLYTTIKDILKDK